jgi:SMODS and SLOG-associating 2TM effector domain 1
VIDPGRLVAFYNEYRLDNQLDFYQRRSEEFGAAANQLAAVSAVMLGLTAIVSALATHESGLKTTFAVLAIALPALSTALAGYGALYAFEQQQKLYGDAVRSLHEARAVGAHEPGAYVEKIEAIFDKEQAQWGQIISETKAAGGGT